jgi:hypothetical protein
LPNLRHFLWYSLVAEAIDCWSSEANKVQSRNSFSIDRNRRVTKPTKSLRCVISWVKFWAFFHPSKFAQRSAFSWFLWVHHQLSTLIPVSIWFPKGLRLAGAHNHFIQTGKGNSNSKCALWETNPFFPGIVKKYSSRLNLRLPPQMHTSTSNATIQGCPPAMTGSPVPKFSTDRVTGAWMVRLLKKARTIWSAKSWQRNSDGRQCGFLFKRHEIIAFVGKAHSRLKNSMRSDCAALLCENCCPTSFLILKFFHPIFFSLENFDYSKSWIRANSEMPEMKKFTESYSSRNSHDIVSDRLVWVPVIAYASLAFESLSFDTTTRPMVPVFVRFHTPLKAPIDLFVSSVLLLDFLILLHWSMF